MTLNHFKAAIHADKMRRIQAKQSESVASSGCSACAECGCTTGHKINCKSGNERARAYQAGLAAKHRKKRKPMFSIEQAADWRERFGISCDIGTARDAMEYAVTMKQNKELADQRASAS